MAQILGNATEFERAVKLVVDQVSFDADENTSVFETTIRILGGLLSAHLLAIDPDLHLTPANYSDVRPRAFAQCGLDLH